jgi:chemotaxis response regulator CheB
MLGIVSSTGGPNALMQVLGGLGCNFPFPIALVQHITSSFLDGFASWLESVCPFSVVIVKDSVAPIPGNVYLAARDRHLRAAARYLRVDASDPVCGQRPSGTVLFRSMAETLGGQALGIVLTGMGEDGAEGLLELCNSGAYTIAEHESSAVVYGMPAEAIRLGGASECLPLSAIAPRILELASSRKALAWMEPVYQILIVEDSETQALQLRYLLEEEGWEVLRASTGESALEELNRHRPALVIVDYHLPGIRGDELCRRIRMNVDTRGIPILMLTAEQAVGNEPAGLDSGADDYVSKSVAPEILLLRVRAMLLDRTLNPQYSHHNLPVFIARVYWPSTIVRPIFCPWPMD